MRLLSFRYVPGGRGVSQRGRGFFMSAWSTLRTAAFAAVAILLISLLPHVCAGQGGKIVSVEIKLEGSGVTEEWLRTTYGYELRVAAGAPSATPTELGIFREWELSKGDKPQAMGGGRMATFQAQTLPYPYGAGEVVYLRWYDHVMSSNPLEGLALRNVFYPVSGVVKFVDAASQATVGSEQQFFHINEPDATKAEVRIPWQNDMIKEDADRAIYTVLNNAGISNQENPSFALPSYSGDLKMVVTLTMAKKAVKKLEFVPNADGVSFDGSARVRMKSPGDKGFMMNQIYHDQDFDADAFYNAYPYPSATNEENAYPEILEGWIMVVEQKGNAVDGVCVDGKYGGRLVKISRRRDGNTPNADAKPVDESWDDFGASPTDSYWLVPLWSDGETIKVKVGPCNAAKLKVHYIESGALYSNLRLWSDAGCTVGIPNEGEVKSGQPIYVTVDVTGLNDCEGPRVLWNVNGSGGRQATASVDGKYSFTPTGNGGEVVNVWVEKETKETKLVYDDAHYSLFDSNGQSKASGSTVACGTKVKVNMKNAAVADGCLERVEVQLGGTVKGSIAWSGSGWQPVETEVRGAEANFAFTRVAKRFSVSWTVGAGYTMRVEAGGSEIANGATVECGSGVKVTVTPGILGQRVLRIKAVGPDLTANGSSTLNISGISQDITAIEVELGPDPSKLTVEVSEEFAGVRVAQVRVYNRTRSKAIWENGAYVDGGRFEEGDELEVSYVPEGGCIDATEVKVEVKEREGGALFKTLKDGDRSMTIPSASKGIDVRVAASGTKRYGMSWVGTNFAVKRQGNTVTSGQQVDCGSSITIVPTLGDCERVQAVKVNGTAVSPDGQGEYVHEVVGTVSSIEVVMGVKTLEVTWSASLGVGVSVGGNSSSPVSASCGAEVRVVLTPSAGDGLVQGVTIGEEGKADATVTKDGASALGFTWEENQPTAGQTTVRWVPKGNVEIKAVSLPRKYRIHFSDGDGYTVAVTRASGAAVTNGEELLEGTQLTVTVEVTNAAKHKVVKVNGDASGITEVAPGRYTYGFSISGETTVRVELGVRKYKVVYAPNTLKVSELKVWAGGWSVARGGVEVSSGAEVAYGSVMYVHVRPAGGAVQGVSRVKVKYKNPALGERDLSVFTDAGEGWYLLDRLEGEVENFEVEVEQLNAGDVYVVYGSAALGGEEERPSGPKGIVRWRKGGADLDAGKKQKVKVSDALKWVLSAAPGVEDGKLRAVCLVVNRQYVAPFMAGERDKDMKLEDVLPAGLLADVQAFRVTTLRLETYVSVLLDARPQLVLTVRKPVLGELEVTMPGAGGAPLDYEVGYKVSGGTTVTVKALAQSPMVLKEARAGVVNLGLTLGEQKQYQLPEYDAASENGNRIPFFAAFARSETADNCLLKLEVNDAEAGSLSAMRRGEALENGKEYQRGLSVEIVVQAKDGYFLKSVRQGGAIVFENTQMDTTQLVRTIPMSLPGGTLFIQAEFAKISKRGVLNGVLAGEAFRELTLSPNPTDGVVEVRGATGVVGYMVFDVSGRAVARGAHVGDAPLRIDLRSLAAGYYLVRFYGEDQRARVMGVMRR